MAYRPKTKLTSYLADYIFPRRCYFCARADEWLCQECLDNLLTLPVLKQSIEGISEGYAPFDYHNPGIAQLIHDFKYEGVTEAANILLDKWLEGLPISPWGEGLIVPIPIHFRRRLARGYNQSERIAATIAKGWSLPLATNLLSRTKYHRSQVNTQSKEQRMENLKDNFKAKSGTLSGRTVYLVDDVITTGATLQFAAQALKPLKPKSIIALALAQD